MRIPDVKQAPLADAKRVLENAGFEVEVLWQGEQSDTCVVESYSPMGSAEKGSTITIVMSKPNQDQKPGHSDDIDTGN